jgi:hypothetical protein
VADFLNHEIASETAGCLDDDGASAIAGDRASMAVKPGRLSMASAPLIQASNLGQGIRSAPYENVRRQSIDRGHRMVGAPNASILIPELRHVEANDSFQKFARRHIAPPFGIPQRTLWS